MKKWKVDGSMVQRDADCNRNAVAIPLFASICFLRVLFACVCVRDLGFVYLCVYVCVRMMHLSHAVQCGS